MVIASAAYSQYQLSCSFPATGTLKSYEKVYNSYNEVFWGEQDWVPSQSEMAWVKEKASGFGFDGG